MFPCMAGLWCRVCAGRLGLLPLTGRSRPFASVSIGRAYPLHVVIKKESLCWVAKLQLADVSLTG
jgi:hypothetical protein